MALLFFCLGYLLQAYAGGFDVGSIGVLLVSLAKALFDLN
jgi:hypothetical protein